MPLNFPTSPTNGQTYTSGNTTWVYSSSIGAWRVQAPSTFTSNIVISVADNTNAALRVTQTGTGASFVVEDSVNPDSTPFIVSNTGNVGIGRTDPQYGLDVVGTVNASSIVSPGDVSGSRLISTQSSGGEGGEIVLATAQTGNNLSTSVTIDIYQNQLRFFETGGTNRGAFINLAIAGTGVSSNLLAGGTGGVTAATLDGANAAIGTGANAFASATIAGANTAVGAGANAFASATIAGANTAVGAGANNFLLATIAGANTAVGAGANAYANLVWSRSNSYMTATVAGANTAVGAGANAFASATIAGANTAVGAGANNFAVATFDAANNTPVGNTLTNAFTSRSTRRTLNFIPGSNITINVDDDSAGNRANITITSTGGGGVATATLDGANTAIGAGANAYANLVWSRSNSYMTATVAGANTAVGAGANAYANLVWSRSNTYMTDTIAGANTAVGAGANSWANTRVNSAAYFVGNNGDQGNSTGLNNIFRVHTNQLTANITITSGNNALAAGPINLAFGKTITIQANARMAIV